MTGGRCFAIDRQARMTTTRQIVIEFRDPVGEFVLGTQLVAGAIESMITSIAPGARTIAGHSRYSNCASDGKEPPRSFASEFAASELAFPSTTLHRPLIVLLDVCSNQVS
jgi:hypothetical protein